MAKFKFTISNGYANCELSDEFEIEDSYLAQLDPEERKKYIEEEAFQAVMDRIDWNYQEIKEDEDE